MSSKVEKAIRSIPDFPKKGIIFRDITTALKDADAFKEMIDFFVDNFKNTDFDYIAGIEARGFCLASAIAYAMNKGFILIRKPGKLPSETISAEYSLEYGTDKLEIQKDALKPGDKVIIMDDLLATGGTFGAAIELTEKLNAKVSKVACLIELEALKGKDKISNKNIEIVSMLKF